MEANMPLQTCAETATEKVFKKKKILPEDLKPLTLAERKAMEQQINDHINKLEGQEQNDFLEKIESICPDKTDLRHQQWEQNHAQITRVLHNYVAEHSRPPTKNELAKDTKLSRQTITNHLREFNDHDCYKDLRQNFKILSNRVLSSLYVSARLGNVKAARLFFEMTGELGNRNAKHFYIQINNIRVDETVIKALPPEALTEIEAIIYKSLPQPKI